MLSWTRCGPTWPPSNAPLTTSSRHSPTSSGAWPRRARVGRDRPGRPSHVLRRTRRWPSPTPRVSRRCAALFDAATTSDLTSSRSASGAHVPPAGSRHGAPTASCSPPRRRPWPRTRGDLVRPPWGQVLPHRRLMECGPHGRCAERGASREATDRLRHIAQLGFITGAVLRGRANAPPTSRLESPARRDVWAWAPPTPRLATGRRRLLLVVTQRRHLDDTASNDTDWQRHWLLGPAFAAGRPTRRPEEASDVPVRPTSTTGVLTVTWPTRSAATLSRRAHDRARRRARRRPMRTWCAWCADQRGGVFCAGQTRHARRHRTRATDAIIARSSGVSAIREAYVADRRPLRRRGWSRGSLDITVAQLSAKFAATEVRVAGAGR